MEPASNIIFDDSLWPLLVVRFSGAPTNQQFEEYLAKRGTYLARKQKHTLLFDTVRFRMVVSEQRQRQLDWLREHAALVNELSIGSALVITSPVVRLALSVILQFSHTRAPFHTARTLPEAASWCAAQLAGAGLVMEAQRVRTHYGLFASRSAG